MDDSLYEPSDEELSLLRRELIRVANRHGLDGEQVKAYMLSTVNTYAERLESLIADARDRKLEYTFGVWEMLDKSNRRK